MNKKDLIKKMMIGLIPLMAFIIADEFFGTKVGLIVAIIIGIVQLLYFLIKDKKLEKFVLFDTGLIIIMGGISFISQNDLFFKLKPALIEMILLAIIGISAFTSKNIILGMQKRYTGDLEINSDQLSKIRKSLKMMFFIFLIHTLLVIYSAFFMSTEAWGFISTALFYIIFGAVFLWQFISSKIKAKNTEWLPVIDMDGNIKGKASREACQLDKSLIHPVIRLHIFNSKKELFLQKRKFKAVIEPGKYDAAVAGHVVFGETIEQAVLREAKEELNLTDFEFSAVTKRIYYGETTTALMFIFVAVIDKKIEPNLKETEGGKFVKLSLAQSQIGISNMSAGLLEEWPLILKLSKQLK
ncbi:MAG: hypothetical protein AUJ98_05435 [Bacteroidetes bacterium CG2_30_33_31]|nr:MAG: hypothetical protein AUJ98_05435 [Bacteroidetes bacterium CG2_30_33_31]